MGATVTDLLALLVFIGLFCGALALADLVGNFIVKHFTTNQLKGDPYVDHDHYPATRTADAIETQC